MNVPFQRLEKWDIVVRGMAFITDWLRHDIRMHATALNWLRHDIIMHATALKSTESTSRCQKTPNDVKMFDIVVPLNPNVPCDDTISDYPHRTTHTESCINISELL